MEAFAATKGYGEEMGVDLFDQIDDLLEFPNDDDMLIDMDQMVGSSGSTNECFLPIDAMPAAPQVETNFEPMLLSLPEDAFLSGTQRDVCDGSSLIKVGDVLNGEDEHIPCDELDMTQLEWLSNFIDDGPSASSYPVVTTIATGIAAKSPSTSTPEPKKVDCTITIPTPTLAIEAPPNDITKEDPNHLFCTSSPVSVLEQTSYSGGSTASSSVSSSSSFSSSNSFSRASLSPRSVTPPEPNFVIPARPRSKRSRPASFSPRNHVIVPFLPPSSETQPIIESMAESDPVLVSVSVPVSVPVPVQVTAPVMHPTKKKKKAIKKASYGDNEEADWGEFRPQGTTAVRRCMHCQIEKTPQWRAGPMGPKTLCNACGVRYKSGRLFPEYRPAASPTFVPSIHSNSHKKVVEMRLKGTPSTNARGCDLLQLIRRKE